ncbi:MULTISPECIES: Lrp/AsnC family transcriptional regulator [Winogradskyella]|jgi:DNA-binding Lrp family transcriptional regulator|uniref:Lrp/AsnC family transcriptional regulator n=2 Tax=Winogradskyella TaxID=286104 RepID=A0A1G8K777_9FLAO|nr:MULTISPECIES: Lrp/AsnC family transcriptional regulator [Winogradskyella]QNK76305.1 Lrp/AsnC family transcriptional regulator [Winogradskyella sp. PAMC22761]RED43257.1 Lrp/AsnC family leucine-responsive transcriptional regulator/Lrp/AsnC family transcriptional regulator [Winogradskyella eximia]SDI39315.1 Lrp/AsnC family transcriptional regulator [Winogradskyella thalassocola]|tara:strand:- start:3 stop:479 length:477 start_codon:yes stop_codon:yes gene_type:complete
MPHTLDKIDTQLLAILQKNSNRTTKSIAEELGMSTSPIFERIKKLEKEGYIEKYVAVLNNKKIGLKLTVFIGITLQGHTRSYLEKFVKEINNFPEVVECHRVSGNFDYLLKLVVEDIEAYETFIISKLTLLPYLGNVQSLIALSTSKETNEIDLSRVL